MPLSLNKKNLKTLATAFNKIITRKNPSLPVLAYVLFEYDGKNVTATATDMAHTLVYHLPADCAGGETGSFLFPFQELKDLRSAVKGKTQTAVLEPVSTDRVRVTTTAAGEAINRDVDVMPVDEFPQTLKEVELSDYDVGAFLRTYRSVLFSAATEKSSNNNGSGSSEALKAVYADPERKRLVTTDGRRLTTVDLNNFPFHRDVIIPNSAVLTKILPDEAEGKIGVYDDDHCEILDVSTSEWRYQTKCVTAQYPNYEHVIPDKSGWAGRFRLDDEDAAKLMSAIEEFAPGFRDKAVYLYGENGRVGAAQHAPGKTPAVVELPRSQSNFSEGTGITLSGVFLAQLLEHDYTDIHVKDPYTPVYCNGQPGSFHLLMPCGDRIDSQTVDQVREHVLAANPQPEEKKGTTAMSTKDNTQQAQEKGTEQKTEQKSDSDKQQQKKQSQKQTQQDNGGVEKNGQAQKQSSSQQSQDPLQELEQTIRQAEEANRQAAAMLREVKKQAKSVTSHYRQKDRELRAREREFEKNKELITRLQKAVND